jgi:hypothetical protein
MKTNNRSGDNAFLSELLESTFVGALAGCREVADGDREVAIDAG